MDMSDCVLGVFLQKCFFSRFHLDDHSGESLCERIVNVSRHASPFFENCSFTLLLDEVLPVRRHHHVVS